MCCQKKKKAAWRAHADLEPSTSRQAGLAGSARYDLVLCVSALLYTFPCGSSLHKLAKDKDTMRLCHGANIWFLSFIDGGENSFIQDLAANLASFISFLSNYFIKNVAASQHLQTHVILVCGAVLCEKRGRKKSECVCVIAACWLVLCCRQPVSTHCSSHNCRTLLTPPPPLPLSHLMPLIVQTWGLSRIACRLLGCHPHASPSTPLYQLYPVLVPLYKTACYLFDY